MKANKKKSQWKKMNFFTLNTKNCRSIYSIQEFREIINYERTRADRHGSVFSVIVFNVEEKKKEKRFIKEIMSRIRLVDHIGWYDKKNIAVLLPETGVEGARAMGNKITENMKAFYETISSSTVYTYPQNWLEKGGHTVPYAGGVKRSSGINLDSFVEGAFTKKMPVWKRVLDIIGAAAGFFIASPLFLALSIYIKLVSPGPIFFKQKRVGFKGVEFNFWKFRTMRFGNNQEFHGKHSQSFIKNGDIPMEKLDDHDPRIFFGGRVIRKSCIDELPQLWNILKGDMSLVGPRPCIPYEAEEYLRWHTHRFDVVPGLTGLWQVSGKNKLTFKQMIRLDINYSKHLSFMTDLLIIAKTPYAILKMVAEAALNKAAGHYRSEEADQDISLVGKSGSV